MFGGKLASGLIVHHLQKQTFINKQGWLFGKWLDEEDLAQFTLDGYDNVFEGLIARGERGRLRAFLGVYEGHPAYGLHHTTFKFLRLNAGLCGSGQLPALGRVMYPIRPQPVWWFEVAPPADSLEPALAGFSQRRYYGVDFMLTQLDCLAEYFANGRVNSRSIEDDAPNLVEISSNKWREGFEFDFSQT